MSPNLELTAPAKINLYLKVLGRRPDGRHELDTVMARLTLADRLILSFEAGLGRDSLATGTDLPDDLPLDFAGQNNLALKAVRAFRETAGWPTIGVRLFLDKRIPWGAGLGGGSADGAAVLAALNQAAPRPLPAEELARLALSLGADLPFCLSGLALSRAGGVGEKLSAPPAAFESFRGERILLIKPKGGLSTARVFANLGLTNPPPNNRLNALPAPGSGEPGSGEPGSGSPGSGVPGSGVPEPGENDLLAPALRLAPALAETAEAVRALRPSAWGLSGSGPTFWLRGTRAEELGPAGLRGWWVAETAIAL